MMKAIFKKSGLIFALGSVILGLTALHSAADDDGMLDRIIATVNDEIVLLSDLQRLVGVASGRRASVNAVCQITNPQKDFGFLEGQRALDQLIDQKILSLKIKEETLNVSDDELESEINSFIRQQNSTKEALMTSLEREGISYATYQEEFRNQIESQRFIGRKIRPLVTVSEDDLRALYLQGRISSGTLNNQKVLLRSLIVNGITAASDLSHASTDTGRQTEKIQRISQEIKEGKPFAQVVKMHSEATDVLQSGGLLPPKTLSELPKELAQKLSDKDLKQGTVFGPLAIGSSVFFFEFLGLDSASDQDFLSQKQNLERKVLENKIQEKLRDFIKVERERTKITLKNCTPNKN